MENDYITEYNAAQSCFLQYDAFRWQSGAILIVGVFAFWGFLISSIQTISVRDFSLANLLVAALMSVWMLFAQHYRQIYLFKLHRIGQLESLLGFEQHLRFHRIGEKPATYIVYGPSGHRLDQAMYVLTSLGASFFGALLKGFNLWLLIPLLVVLPVLYIVVRNEAKTLTLIEKLTKTSHNGPV